MIPSGKAHNEMILPDEAGDEHRQRHRRRRQAAGLRATHDHRHHRQSRLRLRHVPPADEAENLATFAVLVDNEAGVLHRVVGLFAARGYNIESLTVAETDRKAHTSRITIVTRGAPHVLEQIEAQLEKMVSVRRVARRHPRPQRRGARAGPGEGARGPAADRVEALRMADIFRAKVIDTTIRELHVRDHRRPVQDRQVRGTDAPARPCGTVAHGRALHREGRRGHVGGDPTASRPDRRPVPDGRPRPEPVVTPPAPASFPAPHPNRWWTRRPGPRRPRPPTRWAAAAPGANERAPADRQRRSIPLYRLWGLQPLQNQLVRARARRSSRSGPAPRRGVRQAVIRADAAQRRPGLRPGPRGPGLLRAA